MKSSKLLLLGLILFGMPIACKPRTNTDANVVTTAKKDVKPKSNAASEANVETGSELAPNDLGASTIPPEEATVASLQAELNKLKEQLTNPSMTSAQKAEITKLISDLEAKKLAADQALKALTDKQIAAEKAAAATPGITTTSTASAGVGASGFASCGSVYFGDPFRCGPNQAYTCGKADDQYLKVCEIAANSRSGTLFPLCSGATYGSPFACNKDKTCKKSNPNLSDSSICQLP